MDLPDFAKESVAQIQILCTFQARAAKGRRVQRETRALGARSGLVERHAKRRGGGAPLTESYFCLHGPSPQNLHN
ncbi:hypothetical protein [Lancefieldella parvula]|uniref:hypothetical protein n=1 Tax=Lancefieldella parvula TaxID=1382 RepID=UPI0016539B05|nr:hypothetical protein [Lancefieldella parvula]